MPPGAGVLSVIVPHLNQPAELEGCLESLSRQEGVRREVEVLVVDNGSKVLPTEVVARWPMATLLRETTPGPGPARNLGARRARGDILAFIDADCRAEKGWLRAGEAAFDRDGASVVGGDVQVPYVTPGRPTFLEPYEAIYSYRFEKHIREGYAGTGNLAIRRDVFEAVGPFAGIGVAEDRDWGLRARAMGHVTRYVPDMIVYHPARASFGELTGKWDRHISHEFAERRGATGRALWAIKTLAMVASPLAEVPTILTSPRVAGARERWLAFACLTRIRLYRARRMVEVMISGSAERSAERWNRS